MKYTLAIALFVFFSCSPAIRIISDYKSEGFAVTQLKGAATRLYVSPNVDVLEFKISFEREYRTKPEFLSAFSHQLQDQLGRIALVSMGDSNDTDVLFWRQSVSDEDVAAVKRIFDSASEDYFIGIKKVTISNSMTTSPQVYIPATPGSPGGFRGGGVSEDCVVSIKAEIWSVRDKKKVSEFNSFGRSTVAFFMYGTALTNAVEDAIKSFSMYIKENKTR